MTKTDQEKVKDARKILRDPFSEYKNLKPRERKALTLLAMGYASRELAHELDVTVRTAYNIIDRGLIKLSRVHGHLIRREDVTGLVFKRLKSALNGGSK